MAEHHHADNQADRRGSRSNWVFIAFLAIAGFYLLTEHSAHLLGWLPLGLLILCPFMHMFMHGDHGSRGDRRRESADVAPKDLKAGGGSVLPSADPSQVGHRH
jgi:hypothetical protein